MIKLDETDNPFPEFYPDLHLPYGALTYEDEKKLLNYSKGKAVVVDIGTFCGRSAIILSLGAKKVFTVDVFSDNSEWFPDTQKYPWTYKQVSKLLKNYPNINILKMGSQEAFLKFKDESVDTIFIDANHCYDGVKGDFDNWLPKIKSGGIILFHDYYEVFPDVIQFIDECRNDDRIQFVELSEITAVFKKL